MHACLFGGAIDEIVVARYEAAVQLRFSGQAEAYATSVIVTRRLDAEAVEYALRRRGLGRDLARRMQVLCYLVEVRPRYLGEFVSLKFSRGKAWSALFGTTLRSGWKLLKGEYLVRRHGLV